MNNIKILYLCSVDDFDVWVVDGEYIRNNLDIEFTNFGHHYNFDFIPENELWIDEGYENEVNDFIADMIVEYKDLDKGIVHSKAVQDANKAEQIIRSKQNILDKIYIQQIYSGRLTIYLVNGKAVRQHYNNLQELNFVEGGHDLVYSFIPKNSIWIEDEVKPEERKYILLHELYERNLMEQGLKYENAHRKASALELQARKNEFDITKKVYELLNDNELKFEHGCDSFYANQIDCWITANKGIQEVGKLQYSIFDDKYYIKNIEVKPEFKRQGIVSRLLNQMCRIEKIGNNEINFGYITEEGEALKKNFVNEAMTLKGLRLAATQGRKKRSEIVNVEKLKVFVGADKTGKYWQYLFRTTSDNKNVYQTKVRIYMQAKITYLSSLANCWCHCSCPDFMYRWEYVLSKYKGASTLINAMNKPPKITNPKNQTGICKHIYACMEYIKDKGGL